ncbi:MAG: hypothetical protein Q7R78_00885 [bacterium]|nr:hypothetical protein [bacterium]
MDTKKLVWIFMFLGSAIGGYVPELWGASMFSFSSMILGAVGALLGIYIGFKLSRW